MNRRLGYSRKKASETLSSSLFKRYLNCNSFRMLIQGLESLETESWASLKTYFSRQWLIFWTLLVTWACQKKESWLFMNFFGNFQLISIFWKLLKPRRRRIVWLSLHYELERARQNRPFSIGAQDHRPGAGKGAPEVNRLSRQKQAIQDFGNALWSSSSDNWKYEFCASHWNSIGL